MNAFPALLLFWGLMPGSRATCTTAYGDKIRYCKTFQTDYIEGIEILIFEERDVGRINSSVFSSASLKSVLSLTLKGSKIHTIESGAFQQFQSLSNMELQDNRLTTLSPSWFHDPATLKNLTVASNAIGRLRPEMLDGFSNLERLNLSRNQITSIHSESLWSLSKMASLDLSYNKISSLQRQTLSPFNGTLRLGGNPWNCSCAHKDFILFLTELVNASRLADPSSVTCRYPPDLMGALVWNVSEMNCSSDTLPPSPEAAFHKVVLPVLFVVLGDLRSDGSGGTEVPAGSSERKCERGLIWYSRQPSLIPELLGSMSFTYHIWSKCNRLLSLASERSSMISFLFNPLFTIGGLFFSMSMWLIVCILTSRCKNKVTNVADPECPVQQQRPEDCPEPHHGLKGHLADHILEDRLVKSLPPCYVKASEIRSTVRTVPPHNGSPNDKGKDSDRLLPSDLRSSNSEPLVYSVDVSAPVLNALALKTSGGIVAGQAPVRVHPAPELYKQDPINPLSTSGTLHMEAARFCLWGKSNSENETSVHGNPGDSLTGETGLVTYFEAHINSIKNSKNVSKTEGSDPSSEQVSSRNGNPFTFGKKCKTWSAFCVLQDKVIMKPSEIPDLPEKDIDAFVGKGDLSEEGDCKREAESSCTSQEDKEREELSKPNPVDMRPGNDEGSPHKDATSGRNLLVSKDDMSESRAEEGPCRRQHQGPSRKNPTTKPKESRSSEHERFWKYHKNCCDELEPCQTASKVLRQLKTKEVKQELPPDEELLEGRQSLPLLLSKPCKGQIPTNPAISSKKTCVSLPNLNVYENNNPSLISANSQYTEPVQDGKENAPEGVSVYNTDLPVMDLSADAMVSRERLAEALPCKTNLPNEDVLTEDFIRGGEGSYDVSGDLGPNCSDVAPENSAGEWFSTGQDASPCKPDLQVLTIQAQDLVSYDGNSEALPDISAPCGGTLREDEMSQVVSCSNLELPAINLQTEGPIRTEIGYSSSSSNLHLPIIDVSAGGNTVAQDDMLVNKVQEQSAVRDKKFIDVSSGLPDVPILRKDRIPNKVDLPTADVQSEGLVISESNPDDDVHCDLGLLAISEEAKTSGECKTMKPRGSQNVKAKSCPILSVMLDNRDRNPSYNRGRLKSKPDSQAIPVARDPRSNMTTQPDATTFETSQDFPCKPVETMNTSSHESAVSTEGQDLSSSGFSDINFPTETQLTPSGSYSISIQDGDELSAWPNTVDILKQSSTISLSSKYDILEASTVPRSKDDSDHCTVLDNGHNAVCSDISTCGADSLSNKSVLQQYDHKDESDKKASCPEERGSLAGEKGMGQNTLHTCSTLEDLSERHSENQMTDAQRPPQHYIMERVAMNEQTNLTQTSNVEEIVTGKDVEECRKESSDTMIAHDGSEDARQQFSLVLNRQREDPDEQEDPLKDVSSSSLATTVQISQHEAPRSEDKMMKSQKNNSVTGNDQGCTSNLDMSYVSHEEDSPIETNQLDDLVGNDCGSADSLTCRQQKPKNNHQETREGDTMKETHNSDSEDQSSLRPNLSRSKDVTAKIRKNIDARKLDANKTFKTAPCIRDIGQDLKDYISTRLSRRPFQSVFPVSEKTRCLEDDSNLNAFPLGEQQFNKVTEITNPTNMVASSLRQTNGDPEKSSKMTDAIKYLTYLYARSPRPEMTCGVPIEDTTIDDISVLANLQFCKVSGGFIDDAEVPETVREAAEDPKLTLPKPDILYIPPSKEELKSDEELTVLHVMYTLKKSLELSATCEPDNRTDM